MLEQYAIIRAVREVVSKPNKCFSVRGLGRSIGISPGASRTAFEFMKEKKMVTLDVIGRAYQYRANLESPLCRQWKILFNLDQLAGAGIVESLLKEINGIQSIVLYGSFARGTNDEKSDIDILVVTRKPAKTRAAVEPKTSREVNLTVMELNEWKRKASQEKAFYENVVFDGIALFGERPVVL